MASFRKTECIKCGAVKRAHQTAPGAVVTYFCSRCEPTTVRITVADGLHKEPTVASEDLYGAPEDPPVGELYLDARRNDVYVYTGKAWVKAGTKTEHDKFPEVQRAKVRGAGQSRRAAILAQRKRKAERGSS